MTTLIDSNILIDIFGDDPIWYDWSAHQIREAIARGSVVINDVVYAESSIRYGSVPEIEDALASVRISMVAMPHEALSMAGNVFAQYRRVGGPRSGVPPDFFIGAMRR